MAKTVTQTSQGMGQLAGKQFEITKSARFEAAHRLTQADPNHPYSRVHGHSFRIDVTVRGEVKPGERWVEDFSVVTRALENVTKALDHQYLNEIEGLDMPTLEQICVWCAERLRSDLPSLSKVTLSRPSLDESCTYFIED